MDRIPEANHRESDQPAASVSSLSLNDISLSISAPSASYSLPSIPRISLPTKGTSRPPRRPSTASSAQERVTLIPSSSLSSTSELTSTTVTPACASGESSAVTDASEPQKTYYTDDAPIREMNRRAHAAVEGLRAEASRLSNPGKS